MMIYNSIRGYSVERLIKSAICDRYSHCFANRGDISRFFQMVVEKGYVSS